MSPDDINALIDDLLILQEREDEINPHPEELHRTAEKAARLIEEWAMRLDWQQRDLERMRLLTREHGEPVSSPWANSNLTEMDELLQKVQQLERENAEQSVLLGKGGERECALLGKVERLERENAELRKDVYQCPPTSENDYEGLKWADAFEVIEGDNSKLHNEVTALKHENIALREARKPVAVPGLHGVVTWYADPQQLGEAFQREREKCIRFEEIMRAQGGEIRRLTVESDALREDRELLSFLLKQGVCWRGCDKELEGEYWTVGRETEWLYGLDRGRERIRAAIDAARAKEGQP